MKNILNKLEKLGVKPINRVKFEDLSDDKILYFEEYLISICL